MNNDIKKMTALTTTTDFIDKVIFNFFENMNETEIIAFLVIFAVSLWFFIAYMFKKNGAIKMNDVTGVQYIIYLTKHLKKYD